MCSNDRVVTALSFFGAFFLRRKMLFQRSNRRKRDVKSHVNTPKYYIWMCIAMNFAACIAENIIYEHSQMTDLKIIS